MKPRNDKETITVIKKLNPPKELEKILLESLKWKNSPPATVLLSYSMFSDFKRAKSEPISLPYPYPLPICLDNQERRDFADLLFKRLEENKYSEYAKYNPIVDVLQMADLIRNRMPKLKIEIIQELAIATTVGDSVRTKVKWSVFKEFLKTFNYKPFFSNLYMLGLSENYEKAILDSSFTKKTPLE